jgi:hypothetical protein
MVKKPNYKRYFLIMEGKHAKKQSPKLREGNSIKKREKLFFFYSKRNEKRLPDWEL